MLDTFIINLPLPTPAPRQFWKHSAFPILRAPVEEHVLPGTETQHFPHSNSLCKSTWFIFSIAFYIIPFPFYFTAISFYRTKKEKGGRVLSHQEGDWARPPWAPCSGSSWGGPQICTLSPRTATPRFSAVRANDTQISDVIHSDTSHACIDALFIPDSLLERVLMEVKHFNRIRFEHFRVIELILFAFD